MNTAFVHANHRRPDDGASRHRAAAPGSPLEPRVRARLDRLANEVLAAADAGLAHLAQQCLVEGVCAYPAIRARKPTPPAGRRVIRNDPPPGGQPSNGASRS